jgi:uncharacterized membrane protein YeiH
MVGSAEQIGPVIYWLELVGIAVFAASGALTASRKQMDIGGFIVIATVTAIGGGTVRDLLLGAKPVYWVMQPVYPAVCAAVAVVLFFTAQKFESRFKALLWADAIGLSLFCATGTEVAIRAGAPPVAAVMLGVIASTFGGIIRDVLCNEVPLILRREVYATAALSGAAIYALVRYLHGDLVLATAAAFSVCFTVRAISIAWSLSLPAYGHKPGRPYDDPGK